MVLSPSLSTHEPLWELRVFWAHLDMIAKAVVSEDYGTASLLAVTALTWCLAKSCHADFFLGGWVGLPKDIEDDHHPSREFRSEPTSTMDWRCGFGTLLRWFFGVKLGWNYGSKLPDVKVIKCVCVCVCVWWMAAHSHHNPLQLRRLRGSTNQLHRMVGSEFTGLPSGELT